MTNGPDDARPDETWNPTLAKGEIGEDDARFLFEGSSGDDLETSDESSDDLGGENAIAKEIDDGPVVNLAEESDSSDSEGPLLRTGNVPQEWYEDMRHDGYDIDGKKVVVRGPGDLIDQFLLRKNPDSAKRSLYDAKNDRQIRLTDREINLINRIRKGKTAGRMPEIELKPMEVNKTLLGDGFLPRRAFQPNKWERKAMLKIARGIRNGWIRAPQKKEEEEIDPLHDLWKDENPVHRQQLEPPKPPPPSHSESYNPPAEYLFDEQEQKEWENTEPEDRKVDFIPQKFQHMRHVPAYKDSIRESFERCLDLYLCTRLKKKRLNVDPEKLLPELPDAKDLLPYPTFKATTLEGHEKLIRSLSLSPDGEYVLSGSHDKTCRFWEASTGRELKRDNFEHPVEGVAFNPNPEKPCFAVLTHHTVHIFPSATAPPAKRDAMVELLGPSRKTLETNGVQWAHDKERKSLAIELEAQLTGLRWHRAGDYLLTFRPERETRSLIVHRVSTRTSQVPFTKPIKGKIMDVQFHPSKPQIFVAADRVVRVYDLQKQELTHKISTPSTAISSLAIHPKGDHLLVAGYDKRVYWYNLDLGHQPIKNMEYHKAGVQCIRFHPTRPLFASCSSDGTIQVFHAKVFDDLTQNPRIVPVKTLDCLRPIGTNGVNALAWHPTQAWIWGAGPSGDGHQIWCYM